MTIKLKLTYLRDAEEVGGRELLYLRVSPAECECEWWAESE